MSAPLRLATSAPATRPVRHVPEAEYERFVRALPYTPKAWQLLLRDYRAFVAEWPTLTAWAETPLPERLGRLRGQKRNELTGRAAVANNSRRYLLYASLTGHFALPVDWLFAIELKDVATLGEQLGTVLTNARLQGVIDEAVARGWSRSSANQGITYTLPRLALSFADPGVIDRLEAEHFIEFREQMKRFAHEAPEECKTAWTATDRRNMRGPLSAAFGAHAICFQLGMVEKGPKQTRPPINRLEPDTPPKVKAVMDAWLAALKARGVAGSSLRNTDMNLRWFADWLTTAHPEITSLADLNRELMLEFMAHLATRINHRTKAPISATSQRQCLSSVSLMLREALDDELGEVPSRTLVHRGDLPIPARRLPRFIPREQMRAIGSALDDLECAYQRCALLVARWSGARRDEVGRLELDCLDTYADGSPRLRIPAGKTRTERMVPLAAEAAEAIREIQQLRDGDRDPGTVDRVSGKRVRYLFLRRGTLLSRSYLFDDALLQVCISTGLLTSEGGKLITAHRFRHTLGTDLVESGARFRTVMSILGHESPDMTLVYAHISDPEVKKDYEKVIASGAAIAGPAADAIRNHTLSDREVDWLQTNYYKSEMELGVCTRLPEEGPCECDLFLSCSKFFTTADHAPRLRQRLKVEDRLITDAEVRGWPREVERHSAIRRRITQLLADLGEDPESDGAC